MFLLNLSLLLREDQEGVGVGGFQGSNLKAGPEAENKEGEIAVYYLATPGKQYCFLIHPGADHLG